MLFFFSVTTLLKQLIDQTKSLAKRITNVEKNMLKLDDFSDFVDEYRQNEEERNGGAGKVVHEKKNRRKLLYG